MSFAQIDVTPVGTGFPAKQQFGSSTTKTDVNGMMYPRVGLLMSRYTDTTAANANAYLKNYPGATIAVNDTIWMRSYPLANKWVKVGSSTTTTVDWSVTGNTGTTPPINYLGTNDFKSIMFRINGRVAGYVSSGSPFVFGSGPDTISGSVALGREALSKLIDSVANGNLQGGTSVAIGHQALKNNRIGENTAVGLGALRDSRTGWRNTVVGEYAGFQGWGGTHNAYFGVFAGEVHSGGVGNTGLGGESLRGNKQGSYNTGVGFWSLYQQTTIVDTIIITAPGSGYTTATIAIGGPEGSTPGVSSVQATATPIISGGQIVGVTMTNKGNNYSNEKGPVTVTISGDGTGATATATLSSAAENVGVGFATLPFMKDGSQNTAVGTLSGYGIGGTGQSVYDDRMTFIGYGAARSASTASSFSIQQSTAIGYNARVGGSKMMVLGGTGSDTVMVGINTENPRKRLDVVGSDILVHEHSIGRGKGGQINSFIWGADSTGASITTSQRNVMIGYEVGTKITISNDNISIGHESTKYKYGGGNIAMGYRALYAENTAGAPTTGGFWQVAIGREAAYNGGSVRSVAIGYQAHYNGNSNQGTIIGDANTAVGDQALWTAGHNVVLNTAVGGGAGYALNNHFSTAVGALSLSSGYRGIGAASPITGQHHTGVGYGTMLYLTGASAGNTALGSLALGGAGFKPTIGFNIGVGYNSGHEITTGNYNAIFGSNNGSTIATKSRHIIISDGEGSNRLLIDSAGDGYWQGTGALKAHVGTTAQRPGTPVAGMLRYNTDSTGFEWYNGFVWAMFGSGGGGSGTVTSVALTMPSAFTVGGSPVTTNGTLAVTGAGTTAQYIRGDGSLSTFLSDMRAGISLTTTGTSGAATYNSTTGVLNIPEYSSGGGVTDHGALTGLSDDDHLQYHLSAGRSGGQTVTGGTGNTDVLKFKATAGNLASGSTLAHEFLGGNNGATSFGGFRADGILRLDANYLFMPGGSGFEMFLNSNQLFIQVNGGPTIFRNSGTHGGRIDGNKWMIGDWGSSATAILQLAAGTATAGTAPLKFTSGTNLTTPEAGAMEYDGSNFFLSPSTTRKRIPLFTNATPGNGEILIGNGTDFTKANITSTDGSVTVTNGAGTINVAIPVATADEGSYTPTVYNTTNVTASTAHTTYWYKVKNRVYVFGEVEIDATATGAVELRMDMPSEWPGASWTNTYELSGTAVCGTTGVPVQIKGHVLSGRASFNFIATTTTNDNYSFHFSYVVNPN